MRVSRYLKLPILAAILMVATMAFADTVYVGSATYSGGNFTLNVNQTGTSTYVVTYTADFTGWTGGSLYIAGVNFKFGSDPVSSATMSTSASGTWTLYAPSGSLTGGSLANNGCQSNTGATFICADTNNIVNATSGAYTWIFTVTYGSPITDFTDNHIGALFINSSGSSRGILSTTATVPEPASLSFLGLTLGGIALRRFRKR